jgi:hypothetical protein
VLQGACYFFTRQASENRHGRRNMPDIILSRGAMMASLSPTVEGCVNAVSRRRVQQEVDPMIRILAAIAVVLLLTSSSFAQSYCEQVRQAVATYGYRAAKRHALAHYTREEVRVGDRCLMRRSHRRG